MEAPHVVETKLHVLAGKDGSVQLNHQKRNVADYRVARSAIIPVSDGPARPADACRRAVWHGNRVKYFVEWVVKERESWGDRLQVMLVVAATRTVLVRSGNHSRG